MDEILSYGVMALLIILIAAFVWALVKALVRTLLVAGVFAVLWFAAVELFPDEVAALRTEIVARTTPLLDSLPLGILRGASDSASMGPEVNSGNGSESEERD